MGVSSILFLYLSCCILFKLPSLVDVIEAGAVAEQNASVCYKWELNSPSQLAIPSLLKSYLSPYSSLNDFVGWMEVFSSNWDLQNQ